jgi:hypothetical protein
MRGVLLVILALLLTWTLPHATAQVPPPIERSEFSIAREHFRRGEYHRGWETLWPLAKAGDHKVTLFFVVDWIVGGLRVPIVDKDAEVPRDLLTLSAHGLLALREFYAAAPEPTRFDIEQNFPAFETFVRNEFAREITRSQPGPNGDRVAQCYRSTATYRECLDLAIALGVVQSFDDYARAVDEAVLRGGARATCAYNPHVAESCIDMRPVPPGVLRP